MQQFLAKICKGQKTSKDLTWEEAKQAMRLLIEGRATPAQVGGFLVGMRFKMESVTELAAFTAAAREYVTPLKIPGKRPTVDVPTYAGKQDTFHAAIGAAIIAASAGAAVFMHGHDTVEGRAGANEVLAALGMPIELSPQQAAQEAGDKGFAYLDLALYHPPLARFLDLRSELGVRSVVHPVAKLLNPGRASSQVIGVTHPPYLEKTAEALKMLGARRALILRGVEGDPELSIAGATRLLDLKADRACPLLLQPKDIGMAGGSPRDMAGFSSTQVEQEATLLRRILRNEQRGGPRDWVVQNGALFLYAAGLSSSISAGVALAAQTIETGAAGKKLVELAETPHLSAVNR